MRYLYGRQDFKTFERGEENCYLMTNGLGGFSSLTVIGSCGRNDHAVLMSCAASEAPAGSDHGQGGKASQRSEERRVGKECT